MRFPFIKDTSGKPSASLTLSVISFILVSLWFLLSFLGVKYGGWAVREFSEGAAMAYLTPCLLLYFGRRATDKTSKDQLVPEKENEQKEPDK